MTNIYGRYKEDKRFIEIMSKEEVPEDSNEDD
jgi:hypothetical protein